MEIIRPGFDYPAEQPVVSLRGAHARQRFSRRHTHSTSIARRRTAGQGRTADEAYTQRLIICGAPSPFTITYLLDGRFNRRHVIMFKVKWVRVLCPLSRLGPRSLSGLWPSGTGGLRRGVENLVITMLIYAYFSTPGLSALINYTSDTTEYIGLVSYSPDAPGRGGSRENTAYDFHIASPPTFYIAKRCYLFRVIRGFTCYRRATDYTIWIAEHGVSFAFLLSLLLLLLLQNQHQRV